MKKIYLMIAAFAIFMSGCEKVNSGNVKVTSQCVTLQSHTFEVITIDGCEYLYREGEHGSIVLTHKGNCKGCIERQEALISRTRE